jgi:hypothetical protein
VDDCYQVKLMIDQVKLARPLDSATSSATTVTIITFEFHWSMRFLRLWCRIEGILRDEAVPRHHPKGGNAFRAAESLERVSLIPAGRFREMAVHVDPEQPEAVAAAIADMLDQGPDEPDPWWRAGIEEALGE